jgi:CHAT domain-containing protein/tetratricopeptide (TPR) repeat protein
MYGGMPPGDRQEGRQEFRRLLFQAAALHSKGEFEKSLSLLQYAISIPGRDQLGQDDQGKGLIQMGILAWDLGKIPESARHFRAAAAAFERAGNFKSREKCAKCVELVRLYNQGKDDRLARLYYRSIQRFEEAIRLGGEVGIPDLQLKCLRQQSLTYLDLRKLDLYLENNRNGSEIAKDINHCIEQGRCLNNIGVYFQQRHSYSQAVANFERALAMSREANDGLTEAECLNNLGLVYRELGNLGLAEYYLSRALALDEKTGQMTPICMDLENLGSIYLRRGIEGHRTQDLLQALEIFQKSLKLMDQVERDSLVHFAVLNNMGIVLNELKKHEDARRLLLRAMNLVKADQYALERGQVLNNIGATYLDEQRADEAIAHYSSSLEIGSKNSLDGVLMESCLGLGRCYDLKKDYGLALSYYRRSIDALERLRARITSEPFMIGFGRNKFGAYERAIDILADRYADRPAAETTREIFDLIERAKGRAFLESVDEARIEIRESDVSALKERQRAISENISALTSRLSGRLDSSQVERDLKDELELEEVEYLRIVSEMRIHGVPREERWRKTVNDIRDIQRMLVTDDAVLLEYFLGTKRSYLVVVSPWDLKMHILPAKSQIESSLRGYLKWIADPASDLTSGLGPSERIERELIPTGSDETVMKAKALIVIPDGILHYLPFEALTVRDGSGYRYLIERMAVSYCLSASALALLKRSAAPAYWKKELLAIGDPEYAQNDCGESSVPVREEGSAGEAARPSPLPFSRKEVLDIAGLFPSYSADVLAGEEASESRIKRTALGDYRVIHFACHGSVNEQYPSRSALVLSPGRAKEDDGFLQMREIYGLTMNADMVVLSACQTARGILEGSEGSMGLSRPFFFAGARSVIASLWQVNDKPTVVFMHDLYKNLIDGRFASEALRSAKIKMLKSSWKHPFYWASFMLQGNPSAFGTLK